MLLPCSLLGSMRCRLAHAVDGTYSRCCGACLAHGAVGVLMQSMEFDITAVQLVRLTALSACSCSRWHTMLLPCILLGSRRCRLFGSRRCLRAHAVDAVRYYCCAACLAHGNVGLLMQSMACDVTAVQLAWLTALSACSCSQWHLLSLPCSLFGSRRCLYAAVQLAWLTALSAFSSSRWHFLSMQWSLLGSRRCRLAHVVDCIRCYCCAACLAHSAVGVLMHSMAFDVTAILLP